MYMLWLDLQLLACFKAGQLASKRAELIIYERRSLIEIGWPALKQLQM